MASPTVAANAYAALSRIVETGGAEKGNQSTGGPSFSALLKDAVTTPARTLADLVTGAGGELTRLAGGRVGRLRRPVGLLEHRVGRRRNVRDPRVRRDARRPGAEAEAAPAHAGGGRISYRACRAVQRFSDAVVRPDRTRDGTGELEYRTTAPEARIAPA